MSDSYLNILKEIKDSGFIKSLSPSKRELLDLQRSIQGQLARGDKDFRLYRIISKSAEAIKINYALELIETQSIESLHNYLDSIFKEAPKTKVKSTKSLARDINIKSAYISSKSYLHLNHPKLEKIAEIIKEEIKINPNTKFIIFTNFRDSALQVEKEISKIPGISPKLFVGQAKKIQTGLSQKEQIKIIEDFEKGIYNTLISTSIGEEGLDIPNVDQVIFYEPIPSAIRSIQRRGRTARHSKGKIKILMTKNTRDEAYHWTSFHKEKKMHSILKTLKQDLSIKQPLLTDFTEKNGFKILVDSREKGSLTLKELKDSGFDIKLETLNSGDFILSDSIGIERKTVKDFVNSIIDKRLLSQIKELRHNFEKPLLIIEGEDDIYSIRNIHPNSIRGILSTIAIDFMVPIIYTKNYKDTVELIKVISKREKLEKIKDIGLRLEKKPLTTKELQEYVIESFPGIGPSLSKSLLKTFKSIKSIVNAKEEDLVNIDKLGKKKAKDIISIIEEEYT